jgi:hypothetical protein
VCQAPPTDLRGRRDMPGGGGDVLVWIDIYHLKKKTASFFTCLSWSKRSGRLPVLKPPFSLERRKPGGKQIPTRHGFTFRLFVRPGRQRPGEWELDPRAKTAKLDEKQENTLLWTCREAALALVGWAARRIPQFTVRSTSRS